MKKILIIEDDIPIAEIEREFLEFNGFRAVIITDGEAGMKEALGGGYDLILLDLMLPSMDGYEICKKIRGAVDIPILMVSTKIEDIDKIRGLGLGADDYISKPFSPTELVARVKANLAQYERLKSASSAVPKASEVRIGNIRLNPEARRVYIDGREIDCKVKEFDLLCFLMANPETVFSKEALYNQIWGKDLFGDIKTVAVHINRLRDKIEKDSANPAHIQTVWGAGYRFTI
jgi:DNA-binding response OmpR family regulator